MIVAYDVAVFRYDAVNIRLQLDKLELALACCQCSHGLSVCL